MKKFAVLGKKKYTKYPTWVVIAKDVTEDEAERIKHENRYNFQEIIIIEDRNGTPVRNR